MPRWVDIGIAWLIIAAVAIVQERSRALAGVLAAMPLSIPLAMWIVYRETRDLAQTARFAQAALLALLGVGLLSYDPKQPPLNVGDLWTLLTALTYALYIVRLEVYAKAFPSLPLTAVQVLGTTLLALLWVLWEGPALHGVPWGAVLYLGVVATALTTWLQTWGQRYVPAPQAAVLYTLEPVWATLFAFLLLGERLGPSGALGALLVVLATLLATRRSPA